MSTRVLLLGVAGLLLVLCILASLYLLRLDERAHRLQARRQVLITPYLPQAATPQGGATNRARPASGLRGTARRWLGMDLNRPTPYPVPVWIVIPAALLPALALRWLLHGLLGPAAWAVLPPAWLVLVRAAYHSSDRRRRTTLLKQFPDALGTIVRAVRVGIPVVEAIRAVSRDASEPTASEFARVHDQIAIGTPLEDALRELAQRSHMPEYRFFATTMSLQGQTGGGLSETLENLADVIRKRVALKARGYALAAEARTSAGVLAALPILSGLALVVINPAYIAPLGQEGPGQTLLGVAVLWLALGLVAMRALIAKSLS